MTEQVASQSPDIAVVGQQGHPDSDAALPPVIADVPLVRSTWVRQHGATLIRYREASILAVVVVLLIVFQLASSEFLSSGNLLTLSQFVAATAIVAVGEVMLLVSGEIDLSVGMVYALVPFIMHFANNAGLPMPLAMVVALCVALLIGAVNATLTLWLKLPSFIATMGMLFALNGVTLLTSHGFPTQLGQGSFLAKLMATDRWSEITWAVAVVLVVQVVLSRTRWGLHTIAVGSNPIGAAEAGLKINRIKARNFMLAAGLAGFAGIMESFRIGSIDPLAGGTDLMFFAIASAVIGGTALAGGSGTVIGALLGAIVLGELKDGFVIAGVNAYAFELALGIAIVVAMAANVVLTSLRKAGGS